nr:MAG TPA: hypothetical protein [Caudoviricetes sp.]
MRGLPPFNSPLRSHRPQHLPHSSSLSEPLQKKTPPKLLVSVRGIFTNSQADNIKL